jgi:cell division protease FtsH
MMQFLPRGYRTLSENRVKKLIVGGDDWQIYITNVDSYVLAVKPELYSRWVTECLLPTGVLSNERHPGYWIFESSGDYLISSLDSGPYPKNQRQVEAFSIAFQTALNIYDNANLLDAIYIEEYSLILPVSFAKKGCDNGLVYGKWLTGGINISIELFERVSEIMGWLPRDALMKCVKLAGFKTPDLPQDADAVFQHPERAKPQDDLSKQSNGNLSSYSKFTLVGRPELEQFFNDNVVDIVMRQEEYKRMGIPFPGAIVLHGPPGCGKTFAVDKLTEFLSWKRFDIDASTIASSYIHETSRKISDIFRSAIQAAPSILVIDEMEAFLSHRGAAGSSGKHHIEEVAEFLRRIPEAVSMGVLVIAMTNLIEQIDPAILRRGRFDHIIEVKMATTDEIEDLLKAKFAELPVDAEVNAQGIARELDGHPMSDVAFILREAGRLAVKRNLRFISNTCFMDALKLLPRKKEQAVIGFRS